MLRILTLSKARLHLFPTFRSHPIIEKSRVKVQCDISFIREKNFCNLHVLLLLKELSLTPATAGMMARSSYRSLIILPYSDYIADV